MVGKAYRYLFYRIYVYQLRKYGEGNAPHMAAITAIGGLLYFNLLTIVSIVDVFTGFDFVTIFHPSNSILIAFALLFMLMLYYIFVRDFKRNHKHKKIIKEFKKEDARIRIKGTIFVWCYTIGTFLGFLLFLFLEKRASNANFTVFGYLCRLLKHCL